MRERVTNLPQSLLYVLYLNILTRAALPASQIEPNTDYTSTDLPKWRSPHSSTIRSLVVRPAIMSRDQFMQVLGIPTNTNKILTTYVGFLSFTVFRTKFI